MDKRMRNGNSPSQFSRLINRFAFAYSSDGTRITVGNVKEMDAQNKKFDFKRAPLN